MRNLFYFLAAFLLFTAATCQKGDSFTLGEPFQLKVDEQKACDCGDLSIQAKGVKEDSRCPEFTNCVWEGQAIIEFMVDDDPVELILRDDHPQLARKIKGNYSYTLLKVDPYPKSSVVTPAEDYLIEIKVDKIRS